MNRKGIALLVALMVIVLAGAVLAAVLAAVNLEIGTARAAVTAVQAEAALLDLREDLLADSAPSGMVGGAPKAWRRPDPTFTVLGAIWPGTGADSVVWLSLSSSAPATRNMIMVAGIGRDTGGVGRLRPRDRRTSVYPFF